MYKISDYFTVIWRAETALKLCVKETLVKHRHKLDFIHIFLKSLANFSGGLLFRYHVWLFTDFDKNKFQWKNRFYFIKRTWSNLIFSIKIIHLTKTTGEAAAVQAASTLGDLCSLNII